VGFYPVKQLILQISPVEHRSRQFWGIMKFAVLFRCRYGVYARDNNRVGVRLTLVGLS